MPEQKDKLRIAEDFDESPAPPQENPATDKPKFSREIEVGGRKQKFEADSYESLVDKLVEAQTNATQKLQELAQARKAREPEKTSSDWTPVHPIPMRQEDAEHHEIFRRMYQAEFGMTPEDFRQQENQRRRAEAENAAQNDFIRKHQDYSPTPDNAQKIFGFLESQNLPVSKRNLDYAFEELRGELAAKAAPGQRAAEHTTPKAGEAERPVPKQEPTRSTPPSFIRPSLGGRGQVEESGGQEAEIRRIAESSSLPEMKSRIEALFRQQRGSAR